MQTFGSRVFTGGLKKKKQIHIRVDERFLEKLEYLKRLNGFKNLSETVRKIVEKEYRREKES